jgi:hypothetical protein
VSIVTDGWGAFGGIVAFGFGMGVGDQPLPDPIPYQPPAPLFSAPSTGGGGGPGGSLPGDIEFGEPDIAVGGGRLPLGPPDPGFWLSPGVTVGTERTAGCLDAGKVIEDWTDSANTRGQNITTGGVDAGKVIESWVKKP